MILVVGATGQLGGLITHALLGRGTSVRTLVRGGSAYDGLVTAGAEAVIGDLKDRDSVRAACHGVDAVITTANAIGRTGEDNLESVDHRGNADLIDAAAAEGVRRFVFVSALGADAEHPMPLLRAKGLTEQRLRASGMAATVLRPNFYMDTWIPAVVGGPALAGRPVTLVGDGRRRHSMVAMRDVASYAVAALDHSEADGQTLPIGGPQPVTWRDVVAAFERELGRDLPVRTIAPGESIPGVPDIVSELAAALAGYDSPLDMTELSRTYGVVPTPLADVVHDFATAGLRHAG
jgi:Predicted nucleoside-diphosphate-sugar epimerases